MQQTFLSQYVLPAALFIIMLGMGLALKLDDFARVMKFPKAVAIGVACQMILLPLVGYGVVMVIDMGRPELAVGLMVLTFCPGGTTSNMLTYLSRGDVALSITLTAVVSLITPFTIPILTGLVMVSLMGSAQGIALPIGQTIVTLLAITVVPVAIGMAVFKKWPKVAAKAERPVKVLSVVFLFAIIAGLINQNKADLPYWFAQVGAATLVLNVAAMAIGYGVSRAAGLEHKQRVTIGMEVGIQNGTTALLVTGTLLGNLDMTVAPGIYSLIMFATGGLFGYLVNLGRPAEEKPAPAEA